MKKFILLSLALLFCLIGAEAQFQKTVLVEHFTGASCPPCAFYNPQLKPILDGMNNVVTMRYQIDIPSYDPMYLDNPTEVDRRWNYYSPTGVPTLIVDGNDLASPIHPSTVTSNPSSVSNLALTSTPYKIEVAHEVVSIAGVSTFQIKVDVIAGATLPAGRRLHVAAIEEEIVYPSAPGSNGEKEFFFVMKKMFPSDTGSPLPAMASGDTTSFTFDYNLSTANVYDINELAAIAFVQEPTTKEIFQSEYQGPNEFVTANQNDGFTTILDQGSPMEFKFTVDNINPIASQYEIDLDLAALPAGFSTTLTRNGSPASYNTAYFAPANSSDSLTLTITGPGNLRDQIIDVPVSVTYSGVEIQELDINILTPTDFLILDKSKNPQFIRTMFEQAFNFKGVTSYAFINAETFNGLNPAGVDSSNFHHVYFNESNADSLSLTGHEAKILKGVANSGANIFFIGANVGTSLFFSGFPDPDALDFVNNYLGVSSIGSLSGTAPIMLDFVANDPEFDASTIYSSNSYVVTQNTNDLSLPDIVVPFTGSNAKILMHPDNQPNNGVLTYNMETVASSSKTYRTMLATFMMDRFTPFIARNNLLLRSVEFFQESMPLSTNDFVEVGTPMVFPNPFSESFAVSFESPFKGTVEVMDLTGRKILAEEISTEVQHYSISSEGFDKGIYMLRVMSEDQEYTYSKKIVKQ